MSGSVGLRPMLFLLRGTGASWGVVADSYYHILHRTIEACVGVEVVDVRLEGNGLGRIEKAIAHAERYILKRHQEEPERLKLIAGQSQGAVIALEMAVRHDWLKGAIALVPPSHGTRICHRRLPGIFGDLAPDSRFIQDHGERVASWIGAMEGVTAMVIWSPLDGLIWSPRSACIPGALDIKLGPLWNHISAPFSPQALIAMRQFAHQIKWHHAQMPTGSTKVHTELAEAA